MEMGTLPFPEVHLPKGSTTCNTKMSQDDLVWGGHGMRAHLSMGRRENNHKVEMSMHNPITVLTSSWNGDPRKE